MSSRNHTAIESYGEVKVTPDEVYGRGQTILRVGNGGAGATGLVGALAADYLAGLATSRKTCAPGSIEWVCNHSRNTQLALLRGAIDLALTYEREPERLAEQEGWSVDVGCVFHDHFCLAGPADDPAGVKSASDMYDGLRKIRAGAVAASRGSGPSVSFHSRSDASATMHKEHLLWSSALSSTSTTDGQPTPVPWEDPTSEGWYTQTLFSPAQAVTQADREGAYLITDRSTLLKQVILGHVTNTTVFFEAASEDSVLMNSCHALRPSQDKSEVASEFIEYVLSERGQNVIARFGEQETGGYPLFAPVEDGFCQKFLAGGKPRDGKWVPA